jgi:hypothetical protein
MTRVEELAADYWIENTERIYSENLHVSSPVMDAFKAGYEAGVKDVMASIVVDTILEDKE